MDLEECSGNQALKDVVMAFQWIRENIHVFNGDPNNVTVVGSSGGAMLVHLLLLSPSVNGIHEVHNFRAHSCQPNNTSFTIEHL